MSHNVYLPVRRFHFWVHIYFDDSKLLVDDHFTSPFAFSAGSPVIVVEATDADIGENARITYTMDDEFSNMFRIDSATGAITTAVELNREKIPGYTISVTARDNGKPPLSDTTDVEIVIIDVNDNPPIFSQTSYASSIMENSASGTSVVRIQASDPDQGLNGRIQYTFEGGNDGNGAFSIASTSGKSSSVILVRE